MEKILITSYLKIWLKNSNVNSKTTQEKLKLQEAETACRRLSSSTEPMVLSQMISYERRRRYFRTKREEDY